LPAAALAAGRERRRLGILGTSDEEGVREHYAEVFKALALRGYVEGKNLELVMRNSGKGPRYWEKLPALATELAALRPDAVLTEGTQATRAMAGATRTIPIVTNVEDPVGSGFAASLAKPGGNITGLSQAFQEVATKSLEYLRAMVPGLTRLAIFHWKDANWTDLARFPAQAAKSAGIEPILMPLSLPPTNILDALAGLRAKGVQAAYYGSGTWPAHYAEMARVAIRHRLPVWTPDDAMVEAGLLGSLSVSRRDAGERLATYLVRVFQGANPADLPIEFPQNFRFVLNRKTAVALGITLKPDLLLRADRVLE
jgi:putative ABC transport system substrate-binding protein